MLLKELLKNQRIILASQSPRRNELLSGLDIDFDVYVKNNLDESFPDNMPSVDVAMFLANKKANAYIKELEPNDILLTADTIVINQKTILNKPTDAVEAFKMIHSLKNKKHQVITGVCIHKGGHRHCFSSCTKVWFSDLSDEEIHYYVEKYRPYDKAGAYGIQEWLGYIGINKIEGSYYNVMGLPVQKLYSELKEFLTNY